MEIYNKKFVYFEWDKELEGKECFVADYIDNLKWNVNNNSDPEQITYNKNNDSYPFREKDTEREWCFAYYDPDYAAKKAFMEGKTIQARYCLDKCEYDWFDIDLDRAAGGFNFDDFEFRLKPEETKWYIVLDDYGLSRTNSKIDDVVLFEGTEDECIKWMDEHKKFENIMIAWINGAQIELELQDPIRGIRWVPATKPTWDISNNYRIKPEVESVPFDSVQELIDAWDNKYPQNKNRPKGTMPLIWIKEKEKNRVHLITNFYFERVLMEYDVGTSDYHFTLKELFENYTFADGSIIGKVKKEQNDTETTESNL